MSFESIDPSIQRDMAGRDHDASRLLRAIPPDEVKPDLDSSSEITYSPDTFMGALTEATTDLENIPSFSKIFSTTTILTASAQNVQNLENGYELLKAKGHQPEVSVSPSGRPLWFWKEVFSELRHWQDDNVQDPLFKLKSVEDGLYVDGNTESAWGMLAPPKPEWCLEIDVFSGLGISPFQALDYHGRISSTLTSSLLSSFLNDAPMFSSPSPNANSELGFRHITAEAYLTTQALRIVRNEPLLGCRQPNTFVSPIWLQSDKTAGLNSGFKGKWSDDLGGISITNFMLNGVQGWADICPVVVEVPS
jgi:hypothetical protein